VSVIITLLVAPCTTRIISCEFIGKKQDKHYIIAQGNIQGLEVLLIILSVSNSSRREFIQPTHVTVLFINNRKGLLFGYFTKIIVKPQYIKVFTVISVVTRSYVVTNYTTNFKRN
jgi:hypothetical protein